MRSLRSVLGITLRDKERREEILDISHPIAVNTFMEAYSKILASTDPVFEVHPEFLG
jgi:hypothetical protein